ncbi:HAD family hydrolase [Curtobacterium sp. ISL-83]|uniref:HAD family hydrolase n=1 Tax=Curtobacterium sp. ISL-83 TaxID=2819145 RepID=UPI001BE64056|nr:HAD family hydrolase [Curtobacterium sp. ISL-83]MBT2504135.1 HAD family hydrolase [Curtobacterium sp. ISL-83]
MSAVLFDLDGTLMDTPPIIVESLGAMLEGWKPVGADELRPHIGRPLDAIVADLLPDATAGEAARAKARFREHFATATRDRAAELVVPQVPEILRALRRGGTRIAIVTSKITASANELLTAAGILDQFDVVIGTDLAPVGKPAPDLALLAATRLEQSPSGCVVVGDSIDDVGMGRHAGMKTVGVTWGVGDEAALRTAGASACVSRPDDLGAVLLGFLERGAA